MDQVDTLCAVLGDETRVCGALATVLREEQRAVVQLRPEAILACLEQRQALQDELVHLAARRRALVRDVATTRGAKTESATELLPFLPPDPQARLRARVRSLRRALLEARGLERQNGILLDASLDTVNDLLRALRAHVPGARYGADAQFAMPASTERIDRRV
jgi:flagellar biosynthesis/type III secretory pathway chaperone